MKHTHLPFPKSSPRAIDDRALAQQRLVIELVRAEEKAKPGRRESTVARLTVQAVGSIMILLGDTESGCLGMPLAKVVKGSGASRSSVENAIRRLEALRLLRREPPPTPGAAPNYRWLRPVADRVTNAIPNGSSSRN